MNRTGKQEKVALQSNKDRIVAVDIMRFLAAVVVMYEHLAFVRDSGHLAVLLGYQEMLLPRVSPVFFFLAGFFVCRNITWKKALYNAWWCLAPFVLWNCIAIAVAYASRPEVLEGRTVLSLFGCSGLVEGWGHGSTPVDIPLWFMRDLVFLFLLAPVLSKLARYVLPVLVVLAVVPQTSHVMQFNADMVLSPNSGAFFLAGCFLQGLGGGAKRKCMEYCSPVFITVYILLATGGYMYELLWAGAEAIPKNTFFQNVFSLFFLYQVSRWLELHSAVMCRLGLKLAPVTFLTFAGHCIIYPFIPGDWGVPLLMLAPMACFSLFVAMFFALKRWCRPLLHLVAHYKLRAEDVAAR